MKTLFLVPLTTAFLIAALCACQAEETAAEPEAKPIALTEENFDATVLESERLVLVDVWATWCGPCRTIAPSVDRIAADYAGRVVVAKLDVDVAGDIARKYKVKVLPTLLVFKDGEVVDTVPQDRLPSYDDIAAVLDENLAD